MNKEELSQTIAKSIDELGFARIPKAAVANIFSEGESASFDIHDRLKEFVAGENLSYQESEDDEDFFVFHPANAE